MEHSPSPVCLQAKDDSVCALRLTKHGPNSNMMSLSVVPNDELVTDYVEEDMCRDSACEDSEVVEVLHIPPNSAIMDMPLTKPLTKPHPNPHSFNKTSTS